MTTVQKIFPEEINLLIDSKGLAFSNNEAPELVESDMDNDAATESFVMVAVNLSESF